MAFDICEHKIRQIVIKAGMEIRKAKGLPEEKNITILFNETAPLLGIVPILLSSKDADHLPAPHEMKKEDGTPIIPLKKCPQCGKKAMEMFGLCRNCKDAEGEDGKSGKYKVRFKCKECHFQEKSEKPMVIWLQEMGVDFKSISKNALGIRIITNDGIK